MEQEKAELEAANLKLMLERQFLSSKLKKTTPTSNISGDNGTVSQN